MSIVATGMNAQCSLFLIHGWGFDGRVWAPVRDHLDPASTVTLSALPDFSLAGGSNCANFDATVDGLLAAAPDKACWVGWSLGGLLALAAAIRAPAQIGRLLLLCCNPCFVARDDWPGMAPDVFRAFGDGLAADAAATLGRFAGLVAQGAAERKAVLRTLRGLQQGVEYAREPLAGGLNWLREQDLRTALDGIEVPVVALFGEGDALVPEAVGARMAARAIPVMELAQAGHAPMLSRPRELASLLESFCRE